MSLVTWTDGQTLDASDLNGNFGQVESDIAAVAARVPATLGRSSFVGYTVASATPSRCVVDDAGAAGPFYFESPWSTASAGDGVGLSFVGVPVPVGPSWSAKAVIRPVSYFPQYAMVGLALLDSVSNKISLWCVRRRLTGGYGNDELTLVNYSDTATFVSAGATCLSALPDTSIFGLGFTYTAGSGLSGFSYSGDGRRFTPIGAMTGGANEDYVTSPTHAGICVWGVTSTINIANPSLDATPIVLGLEGWSLG